MNKRIAKKLSNRGGYKHYKTFYFILNSPFSSIKEYISIKKVWKQQMKELRKLMIGE
jgi:hypothetical protein